MLSSRLARMRKAVRIKCPGFRRIAYMVYRTTPALFVRKLKLKKLLIGGAQYSRLTCARLSGNLLAPSTPVAASPHAQFLRTYREIGDSIFQPKIFAATSYCKYVFKCIEIYGNYFSHTDIEGVLQQARSFTAMYDGLSGPPCDLHHSQPGAAPEVMRIKYSDCYEVFDGHHRLAIAAVRGLDEYPCAILPTDKVLTPMQLMVMDSVWLTGKCRLSQPVPIPELNGWSEERRCTDRLKMITGWLNQRDISSGSSLDLGASYGWFVSEMAKLGYKASGVEQNSALATVGPPAYGLDDSAIKVENLSSFLKSAEQKYGVVFCFSVLQDYLLGLEKMSATEFIRLVDKITGSVLFFDTAECHETRYRHSLAGWNAKYIQNWLQENTSFSKIEILGTDSDRTRLFPVRYGRHLFACSR